MAESQKTEPIAKQKAEKAKAKAEAKSELVAVFPFRRHGKKQIDR